MFQTIILGIHVKENTVDGEHPANQLRLVAYTIIYKAKVLYIPGGAGFFPSTVSRENEHVIAFVSSLKVGRIQL